MEENKKTVTETQQFDVTPQQSSQSSFSAPKQNSVDLATAASYVISSQPPNEAPPIDGPVQGWRQEQGLEIVSSSQPSQCESEATTELSVIQTCTLADDELLDVRQEQPKEESMIEKLLRCGGDVRTLLTNQPLSSFLSSSSDNDGKRAGQMITGKNDEKGEEEEEETEIVRFVRPRRLRRAVSKKAASDGFPSAIAHSLRWHPDHMRDLPGDATLSIREAFDNKYDEYYVFRHWRPSQGR